MKRSLANVTGFAAAFLMIALIGAMSLTGRWPVDAPLTPAVPNGILSVPVDQVARIEIAAGDKRFALGRNPAGGWLVNGSASEATASAHIDTALRLLKVSAPKRVFEATEYGPRQVVEYGLDPPRVLISVVETGGKTTRVELGEQTPGQNSQYARLIGQSSLYLLSRDVGEEWQLALDMAERAAGASSSTPASRSTGLLLPVSIAQIWAIEIVAKGTLTRFERDPAGAWFHHFGQHVHTPGGFVHQADPKLAPLIAAELAALERSPVEQVVARHVDSAALDSFGLEHPPSIMLLYSRDSAGPIARVAFGKMAEDGFQRYVRVEESDTVVTVPRYETRHLTKLLQLASQPS